MDDNFKFFGFPENNEIEIEDSQPKKSPGRNQMMGGMMSFNINPDDIMKQITNLDADTLRKLLPQQLLDEMNANGVKLEDAISELKVITPDMLKGMMGGMNFEDADNDCTDEDLFKPEEEAFVHPLIDTKYLYPDSFGSILVKESENLYEEFTSKYGLDSTKYLDSNVGVKLSVLDEITSQLPFASVKDLKFVMHNNRFILYYAEPEIDNLYGFFVGFFKDENDEFCLYVPEFGNTFYVDEKTNEVSLYKPEEHPELFKADPNTKTSEFQFLALSLLELAMYYVSAPQKKVLLSPVQFGTIKNVLPSVKKAGMFLRIGTIVSNESPEAILLKKDAELDLNEKKFPLYIKFNEVIGIGQLQEISQILFKADLNNSLLIKNSELKYTSDHRLYIDIDLGEL